MKKYRETLASLKKRLKNLYRKSLQIRLIRILSETAKSCGIYLYLAWLACLRKITVGEFSQYFNAAAQFSESLLDLGTFFMNLNVNGNYIDSFRDFMELEPMMKKDGTESVAEKDRLMLSLSHVRFHYRGSEKLILDDINYTFEQGKVYVLVGENGAGKTTLIQLLCRLYEPDEGTVCLNHVAADQFPLEEYRSMFSIVFQDFHYFAFTVGENIAFGEYEGKKETVQERIRQALKKAGLKKKVESLPKGMDTYLDKIFYEDGTVLSGGENQKLALARALFHEAKILILDEPCSALDPLAEDALFHAFQETAKDKITIYISHRLSSAVLADHVLFLKNGKIWESGSHEELLQKGGDYAEYYHAQAKYYQE